MAGGHTRGAGTGTVARRHGGHQQEPGDAEGPDGDAVADASLTARDSWRETHGVTHDVARLVLFSPRTVEQELRGDDTSRRIMDLWWDGDRRQHARRGEL